MPPLKAENPGRRKGTLILVSVSLRRPVGQYRQYRRAIFPVPPSRVGSGFEAHAACGDTAGGGQRDRAYYRWSFPDAFLRTKLPDLKCSTVPFVFSFSSALFLTDRLLLVSAITRCAFDTWANAAIAQPTDCAMLPCRKRINNTDLIFGRSACLLCGPCTDLRQNGLRREGDLFWRTSCLKIYR